MAASEETKQHTPGPWVAEKATYSDRWHVWAGPQQDEPVAEAFGAREANAKLIAAAPDLLAEVERLRDVRATLLDALTELLASIPPADAIGNPAVVKARDAILKATA